MSIKPKFIQVNCIESDKLDTRQAEAIKKYRPDVVLLEYPNNNKDPGIELNNFLPADKPNDLVRKLLAPLPPKVLKIHPWAASDRLMWTNINALWQEGHQVLVYKTDAPSELTSEWLEVWNHAYPQITKNWVWWVQIYLRERLMADNIKKILGDNAKNDRPVVAVFLQSFHWKHVKFLLTEPKKNEIWQYYFGQFKTEVGRKDIAERIKKLNPVFYKYWVRYSDF
jgi:hypothetical protein